VQDHAAPLLLEQIVAEQSLEALRQRDVARHEPVAAEIEAPSVLHVRRAETADDWLALEHDRPMPRLGELRSRSQPAWSSTENDERAHRGHSGMPPLPMGGSVVT
jgi:hypothetical protein